MYTASQDSQPGILNLPKQKGISYIYIYGITDDFVDLNDLNESHHSFGIKAVTVVD